MTAPGVVRSPAVRLRWKAQRSGEHRDAVSAGPRLFVEPDVTPEALVELFQQHMASEAKEILGSNLGRWMRVTGTRGDVVPLRRKGTLLRFERTGSRPATRIEMNFDGLAWRAILEKVPRSSEIAVVGVLRAATRSNSAARNARISSRVISVIFCSARCPSQSRNRCALS